MSKNFSGPYNLKSTLEKIKNSSGKANILLARPDLLIMEPVDYKMGNDLGAEKWCIQNNLSFWNDYVNLWSIQYYVFDFTKSATDQKSMIAATVRVDGKIREIQYRSNNGAAKNDFKNKEVLSYFKPRSHEGVFKKVQLIIDDIKSIERVGGGTNFNVYSIKSPDDAKKFIQSFSRSHYNDNNKYYNNFYLVVDKSEAGYKHLLGIAVEQDGTKHITDANGTIISEEYLEKFM